MFNWCSALNMTTTGHWDIIFHSKVWCDAWFQPRKYSGVDELKACLDLVKTVDVSKQTTRSFAFIQLEKPISFDVSLSRLFLFKITQTFCTLSSSYLFQRVSEFLFNFETTELKQSFEPLNIVICQIERRCSCRFFFICCSSHGFYKKLFENFFKELFAAIFSNFFVKFIMKSFKFVSRSGFSFRTVVFFE